MKKLPNGYGGISYLGKGRRRPYVVRFTVGVDDRGYQIYKVLGYYATRTEAFEALSEYHKNPFDIDSNKITFKEIYDLFHKNNQLSTQRLNHYDIAFRKMKDLHNIPYQDLNIINVNTVINDFEPISYNNCLVLLKKTDLVAQNLNIRIKNVGSLLKSKEVVPKFKKTIFTREEIKKIYDCKDEYYYQLILIYLYTGWRLNELFLMKKEDIDLINRTMTGGLKTKAGKKRVIPIHDIIMPFIEALYNNTEGEYLINQINHSTYALHLRVSLGKIGIKHSIHECRHTFRTELDNNNVSSVVIDKLMGHSGSVGEVVYTHKSIDQLREAINSIKYL